MNKVEVLRNAGLACGESCSCVTELAVSLNDEQAMMIATIAAHKGVKTAEAVAAAALGGEARGFDIGLGDIGNDPDEAIAAAVLMAVLGGAPGRGGRRRSADIFGDDGAGLGPRRR